MKNTVVRPVSILHVAKEKWHGYTCDVSYDVLPYQIYQTQQCSVYGVIE